MKVTFSFDHRDEFNIEIGCIPRVGDMVAFHINDEENERIGEVVRVWWNIDTMKDNALSVYILLEEHD